MAYQNPRHKRWRAKKLPPKRRRRLRRKLRPWDTRKCRHGKRGPEGYWRLREGTGIRCQCRGVALPVLRRVRGRITSWARVVLGSSWKGAEFGHLADQVHDRLRCRPMTADELTHQDDWMKARASE